MADHVVEILACPDQCGFLAVDQNFGGAQAPVVLITHAETVGARIFHDDQIALGYGGGKFALLDPEVRIFTELSAQTDCGARFQLVSKEPMGELVERLKKRKSADFVVIDSIQDSQISRAEYRDLKRLSASKMLIFVSRVEGCRPMGRLAVDIKFDADLKVWVEGGRAMSEGRYLGRAG